MVHVQLVIGPFETKAAVLLIIVTSVIGYVFGTVGAFIWNRIHR